MVEVTLVPGQRRPGVGKAPAREARRAWLPQQARFCPVLEDASKTGYLVYPPLFDHEALQVRYMEENFFRFSFFVDDDAGTTHRLFVLDVRPSAGGGGVDARDVVFLEPRADIDEQTAFALIDALTTNLNAPPGAVGLRGSHDFVTPEGWDTIYLGVLNEAQRPHLPTLSARVETDWYAQSTEFRYVLQPGDVLSTAGSTPIGQVHFVPREDVRLREATQADLGAFAQRQRAYWEERMRKGRMTNFGALYSYHYRDLQKARREQAGRSPGGE